MTRAAPPWRTVCVAGAAWLAACAVFPDRAELPAGASGGGPQGRGGEANGAAGSGGSAAQSGSGGDTGGSAAQSGSGGDTGGNNTGGTEPSSGGTQGPGTGGEAAGALSGSGGVPQHGGSGGEAGTDSSAGVGGGGGTDPECVTTTLIANRDAHLLEADAKTNFGNATKLLLSGVSAARANVVIGFDLATIPTMGRLDRATLRLVRGPRTGTADPVLSVFFLTQPFTESRVSWQNARNNRWDTPGGDVTLLPTSTTLLGNGLPGDAIAFDLTTDVAGIRSQTMSDNGWLLTMAASDTTLELGARDSPVPGERPSLEVRTCP